MKEASDPTLTMAPLVKPRSWVAVDEIGIAFWIFIAAETYRVTRKVPTALTRKNRSNSDTSASEISFAIWTPICVLYASSETKLLMSEHNQRAH